MGYKRKLIALLIVIALLVLLQKVLPYSPHLIAAYNDYIFHPWQYLRTLVSRHIPVSIGDLLYVLAALSLLTIIIRWFYFLIRFSTHKHQLAKSLLNTIIFIGCAYIVFVLSWGANYYKPSLPVYWSLEKLKTRNDDSIMTISLNKYLIGQLNSYAPHYHDLPFDTIDTRVQRYYDEYTDAGEKLSGLKVKPSVFGYMMEHFQIQGYYNPFTGEGQVNRFLPAFMLPFVVSHEMAHQAGIAAEGDANLLAYTVGTAALDSSFNYSCYFNIWLYAQSRLYRYDTIMAKQFKAQLNKITIAQIDTLKAIRRRYHSEISNYSADLYDSYLRLHHQKGGIRSYGNVVASAWAWEQKRKYYQDSLIHIP